MNRLTNPIVGPNKFKFGLFNANCDGGFADQQGARTMALRVG